MTLDGHNFERAEKHKRVNEDEKNHENYENFITQSRSEIASPIPIPKSSFAQADVVKKFPGPFLVWHESFNSILLKHAREMKDQRRN